MDEKNEDSSKVKHIIEILRNSRKEQKVNVEQLCEGVCTKSMLEKVEWGERAINRNSLNRLLARLGIDQKKYEKYLYYKDYDEWKAKNDIINAIEDGEIQRAEALVSLYEEKRAKTGKIEQQFCLFMKAQILQHMDGVNDEEIEGLYRAAMMLTIPNAYKKETSKLLLSTDELNLILECRNREIYSADVYEIFDIYQGFIEYIEKSRFDIGAKAKIYPKVVVYMYNHVKGCIDSVEAEERATLYRHMLLFCENAIDILRDDCKSYYMTELLTAYIDILSYLVKSPDDVEVKSKYSKSMEETNCWLNAYISMCKRYDISFLMKDCCYIYREEDVYCVNDIVRKRRNMFGMTMNKLCDNICDTKTLRRFERRESNAIEGIVDELFWRLGISDEYVNMGIVTDSQEAVELYEKCRREFNAKNLNYAKELLDKLKSMLPECRINRQALLETQSMIEWYKKELSYEEHIHNLMEVLRCTIELENISDNVRERFFSYMEITSINSIAMAYKTIEKYQEAYEYISVLVEYYSYFEEEGMSDVVVGLYEMIMCFYGSLIGSMGRYEESNDVFDKLNKLLLKLRRTNMLHINIYNIAWNNKENGLKEMNYRTEIEKCYNLCQLTKNQYYESAYRKLLE